MHNLTYKDLSGRRRPRRYVVAAICILLLLAVVAVYFQWNQARIAPVPAAAIPVSLNQYGAVEVTLTAEPPAEPTVSPARCLEDPQTWSFVQIFPDDNYRRIQPACVYDGLARTAAWMLLERLGHSKTGAAELLGMPEVPWSPVLSVEAFTNTQGPIGINLSLEWPAHPAFQFWQVDRDGQPAIVLSLRGCYPHEQDVFCVLALDRSPGSAVSLLGDLHFASHAAQLPGQRSFFLVRYAGADTWHLLGQMDGLTIEFEDNDEWTAERSLLAVRLGVIPWDAGWLAERFELAMEPLPQGWRLFGMDEKAILAISEELNQFISPDLGGEDE